MAESLFELLAAALAETDVARKLLRVQHLDDDWRTGQFPSFSVGAPDADAELPIVRGVPARLQVVAGNQVPRRRPGTVEGRAALLHAVAHIEYSAIDLALDHAFRFRGLPVDYTTDWLRVAADEARHFALLQAHLRSIGYDYGDFPVHDSLWQMAVRTAHDPLARMALVPRLMEARGLDATPPILEKLQLAGDHEAVRILEVILQDEIGHVAIGDRWFRYLCVERKLDPESEYRHLIVAHRAPWPQLPMNEKARREAGFSVEELARLTQRLP
jgi:uncharacterized ferritin-like protein (DUF455 family)